MKILKASGDLKNLSESTKILLEKYQSILKQKMPPAVHDMLNLCKKANETYNQETLPLRTLDDNYLPGGIIRLFPHLPTVIVPDLHARLDFFYSIMLYPFFNEQPAAELLAHQQIQIVCLGDGFHAEGRAALRWQEALLEFQNGFQKHTKMDEEMKESLGVMQMVMAAKINFPQHFHFLKGNHENIANENACGNYPFRKYAYEGAMVLEYIRKFYGLEFLEEYYTFEKNLPLLAVGPNFLISHAEPKKYFNEDKIINYRKNPEVVSGLTWTDNDEASAEAVKKMLNYYIPKPQREGAKYFGGHRTVKQKYQLRAGDEYIQFHNPNLFQVAVCLPDQPIDPEKCIIEIKNQI